MPNNRKITVKKIKGKEGAHPGSRKAAQITRSHLRSAKLVSAKKDRKELNQAKMFRPVFFFHSLSGPQALSLPSLRALVSDVYLARNDPRIEELTAERRPGRPKAKELLELEELRRRENAEWETGFEVMDLTDPAATRLLYSMVEDGTSLQSSHLDLIPHIRVFKDSPETTVVSRPSKLGQMGLKAAEGEGEDWTALKGEQIAVDDE